MILTTLPELANDANRWLQLAGGARVHATALVGFQPIRSGTFARPVGEHPPPRIGRNVVIGPYAIVYAGCEIGDDTVICPHAHIREGVRIGKKCVIGLGAGLGYNATMGDRCQIMDHSHLSGGSVVGDDVFISVHVLAVNDDTPKGYQWKGVTPVTIGDRVVIGAGARIRPGLKIGEEAVIAMGSVLTRDVPAGAMVKGPVARAEPFAAVPLERESTDPMHPAVLSAFRARIALIDPDISPRIASFFLDALGNLSARRTDGTLLHLGNIAT